MSRINGNHRSPRHQSEPSREPNQHRPTSKPTSHSTSDQAPPHDADTSPGNEGASERLSKTHGEPEVECQSMPTLDVSVLEVIQMLHRGDIKASEFPLELRRECVAHMTDEGYTSAEIASVLVTTDRTIRRDRAAVRKANAVAPGLELGDEMLGEMQRITYNAIQKLTRLMSEHDASQYTRLWASEAMCRVYEKFVKMAQSMEFVQVGRGRLRKLNEKKSDFDPLVGPASDAELDVLRRLMKVK